MLNISQFSHEKTARTSSSCAYQRAENLAILGCKNVLELCVGPSLKQLEMAYKQYQIQTTGNDIEPRWQKYYPDGKWIIGDARKINTVGFDAVVVAPPLSKGCSGKREDALSIDEVFPSYYDFLHLRNRVVIFTLPGKTLSIREDRKQLYKLMSNFTLCEIFPLKDKVIKYLDLIVRN